MIDYISLSFLNKYSQVDQCAGSMEKSSLASGSLDTSDLYADDSVPSPEGEQTKDTAAKESTSWFLNSFLLFLNSQLHDKSCGFRNGRIKNKK